MKAVTITKSIKVQNTDAETLNEGVMFFQLVKFIIDYYGNKVETIHDTKIMDDGRQFVIGGCGYIEHGYEIK